MTLIPDSIFHIEEFVPPETMNNPAVNPLWFIDMRVVEFLEWLKNYTGGATVTINNYLWGGRRKYSGYRPPTCDVGAPESSHRRCIAVDVKVGGYTPAEVRNIIRANFKELNRLFGLTAIEKNTKTWTHIDFRFTGLDYLFEIKYYTKRRTP